MGDLVLRGGRDLPRWSGTVSAVISAAAMLLLTWTPLASGAAPYHVLTAPYSKTNVSLYQSPIQACANASIVVPPSWHPRHGTLKTSVEAFLTSCPSSPHGYRYGVAGASAEVEIPFKGVYGNNQNISVVFNWTETTRGGLKWIPVCLFHAPVGNSTSQSCSWRLYWLVEINTFVWDRTNQTVVSQDLAGYKMGFSSQTTVFSQYTNGSYTNGTRYWNSTSWSRQDHTTDFNDSVVGTGTTSINQTVWLNNYFDRMVSTHQYEIVVQFIALDGAAASVAGLPVSPTISGLEGAGYATNVAAGANSAHVVAIIL